MSFDKEFHDYLQKIRVQVEVVRNGKYECVGIVSGINMTAKAPLRELDIQLDEGITVEGEYQTRLIYPKGIEPDTFIGNFHGGKMTTQVIQANG